MDSNSTILSITFYTFCAWNLRTHRCSCGCLSARLVPVFFLISIHPVILRKSNVLTVADNTTLSSSFYESECCSLMLNVAVRWIWACAGYIQSGACGTLTPIFILINACARRCVSVTHDCRVHRTSPVRKPHRGGCDARQALMHCGSCRLDQRASLCDVMQRLRCGSCSLPL